MKRDRVVLISSYLSLKEGFILPFKQLSYKLCGRFFCNVSIFALMVKHWLKLKDRTRKTWISFLFYSNKPFSK